MPMWNREGGRRDRGGRARDLVDRAGDALRRGVERLRGEDDVPMGYRGDWRRGGDRGRWGRPRSDLPYGLDSRDEGGWGSVHYDRDFGYGAFGAIRDRGFEDRPYDMPGLHRSRDDQHMRSRDRYEREMRGRWERPARGYDAGYRRGMTPGWRGRGFEGYGGYSHGLGDEPYYNREDFRGRERPRRYDRDFEDDWF